MAIANSDGSIILSTKVDTSGMKQGTKSLKSQAAKLAAEYRKAGMSQSEAFKKAWSEIERTKVSTEKATVSTKKFGQQSQTTGTQASAAISKIGAGLKSILTYFIGIQTVFAAIRFSGASAKFATQTEASVQRLVDIYGSASDSVGDFIDANARALGMSKAAAASFSSVYGNLFSVWADQATNAELTNRYLNMTAVVASKTGRTVEDVQERVRSGLLGNTEAIEDLGIFVNVKTIEMTDAFQRMADGKSWEQLDAYTQQQVRSMAILEQATAKYGNEVADTSATIRNRYKAAYEDFQNSWGNIVNIVLLPVLETLTQIFDIATKTLNAFLGRNGKILENVQLQEENTNKTAENIEKQVENQKDLNKEMKKTLAGFDDLQILTSGSGNDASSEALDTIQNSVNEVTNLTDVEDSTLSYDPMAIVEELKSAIDFILPVIEIALVVIGLIVLSTGRIGLGIGFIAAGAYLYSVTERSEGAFDFNVVKKDLEELKDNLEVVLTAIGVILLFFGQISFGVGFIVAGAAVYAIKEISTEEYSTATIEEKLAVISEAVSLALVAIGIILIFLGNYGFGVGFIISGAYLFKVSEQKLNEGAISTKIDNMFNEFGQYIEYSSYALIWLGVVLLCFGVINQYSIGLIVTGVGGLAVTAEMSGTTILDMIKGRITSVIEYIQSHGFAMVVIGLLAMLTGAGLLPGLALIGIGISGMVQGKDATTNNIVGWIKKAWEAVKTYWNTYIAPVFTLEWWANLGKNCINGFIKSFETGINAIITMFESMLNFVITAFNKISFDVPEWVPEIGGKKFGFDFDEVDLGRVSIPKLATGAVIPPNREFLAVLGDNTKEHEIVSPLSTMKQAFTEAMLELGGNFGGGNTEVVLEIDGREFGRAVVEQGNRENRRIGTRLVIV